MDRRQTKTTLFVIAKEGAQPVSAAQAQDRNTAKTQTP